VSQIKRVLKTLVEVCCERWCNPTTGRRRWTDPELDSHPTSPVTRSAIAATIGGRLRGAEDPGARRAGGAAGRIEEICRDRGSAVQFSAKDAQIRVVAAGALRLAAPAPFRRPSPHRVPPPTPGRSHTATCTAKHLVDRAGHVWLIAFTRPAGGRPAATWPSSSLGPHRDDRRPRPHSCGASSAPPSGSRRSTRPSSSGREAR